MRVVKYFTFSLAIGIISHVSSQTYLGYYFNYSTYNNYTEIIGGNISTATGNDGAENLNLPFSFKYMGITYTTARISVNGWMEMGQTYTGGGAINELESTVKKPLICPLWEDLYADSQSEIRYETLGEYPARFFVVQWKNIILSSGDRKDFQIRLWEIDGTIEFIYGPGPTIQTYFDNFSVGMNNHIGGSGNFISITIESQYYYTVDTMVANNGNNDLSLLQAGMMFSFVPIYSGSYSAYLYQNPDTVIAGNPDQKIFAIIVPCHAGDVLTSPWVTKFNLNTNGTTTPDDILNAKLYTTYTYPYFSTNNQLGQTYQNPNGLFEIGGFGNFYLRNNGLTYFWLAYDISPNATIGNYVDGNCYRIDMEQCCPSMIPDTTLATAHCIISNTGIQGNFTVGTGEDYENLEQAFYSLRNNILSGPVTLELTNNYNPGTEIYPVLIPRITNTSETNTVTIQTSEDNIIFQSSSWSIFHFKDSRFVIIEGLDQSSGMNKIKIINNSTAGNTVYFSDGSSFNIVKNCDLQASDISVDGAVIIFHESPNSLSLVGNQIISCTVNKNENGDVSNGFLFKRDLTAQQEILSTIPNVIKNCIIKDFSLRGISIENNLNSFHLIGNSIFHTIESSSSTVEAIYFQYGSYPPDNPDIIEGNKIYNLQPKNVAGNSVTGIRLPGGFCVKTLNNFISLKGNEQSTVTGITFASYGYYSILDIYYNSILIYGISSSDCISSAFRRLGATTYTKIKNNIFINYRTNTLPVGKNYCLYFDNDNALPELDYNNYYYAPGSDNFLSYLEGIDVINLNQWINLTSRDFNSGFTNVTFVSDIDLHLTGSSIGDSLLIGVPISGITTDIDGELRDPFFPYKGADEVDGPVIAETIINLPISFSLSQNYPNPFNPVTSIQYAVSSLLDGKGGRQFVTLKVYDILGHEIATLVNEEKQPGTYEVKLNGEKLPSGIYFYQLKAGQYSEAKKMILLK